MNAAHLGEVRVKFGGGRTLRYDWAALSRLRTAIGKDYEQEISRAMTELDTAVLSKAIACGLTPPMSAEELERESPPLLEVVAAIELALKYAYYGGEEPRPTPTDPPPGPSGWWTRSLTRIGSPFGRAWRRWTSGG